MKNVLQQTNNLFRNASCMNRIKSTPRQKMQILWPLFIRYELIASVWWRQYLRRLIGGRSKFLLLNVTKQERGIQQINYVTEPGPRLVGVTRRQAFQFWSLCPPLPLRHFSPTVIQAKITGNESAALTHHTQVSIFGIYKGTHVLCFNIVNCV